MLQLLENEELDPAAGAGGDTGGTTAVGGSGATGDASAPPAVSASAPAPTVAVPAATEEPAQRTV